MKQSKQINWIIIHGTRNQILAKGLFHYLQEHEVPVRIMERQDNVYTIFRETTIEVPEEHQTIAAFLVKSYLQTNE